jgi:hypothetical protein
MEIGQDFETCCEIDARAAEAWQYRYTIIVSVFMFAGLRRNSSQPAAKHNSRTSGSSAPVTTMMDDAIVDLEV